MPAPSSGSGPKRPILPYRIHGLALLAQDLVFEIDRAVFIDLRRAHPAALANLAALGLSALGEKLEMKVGADRWHVPFVKVLDDIEGSEASLRYAPSAAAAKT